MSRSLAMTHGWVGKAWRPVWVLAVGRAGGGGGGGGDRRGRPARRAALGRAGGVRVGWFVGWGGAGGGGGGGGARRGRRARRSALGERRGLRVKPVTGAGVTPRTRAWCRATRRASRSPPRFHR